MEPFHSILRAYVGKVIRIHEADYGEVVFRGQLHCLPNDTYIVAPIHPDVRDDWLIDIGDIAHMKCFPERCSIQLLH